MPDCIPYFEGGGPRYTGHADVALTGQRCVRVTGPSVDGNWRFGLPVAAGKIGGVAARDCAAGDKVTILAAPGEIYPVQNTAAAIAAGAELEVTATGLVQTLAAGVAIGRAMDDAAPSTTVPMRYYGN